MKIIEVKGKEDSILFVDFPKRLYRDDPHWVAPLDKVLEAVFDPARNHSFRNGTAARWLAIDVNGNVTGRIAAFTDKVRSAANAQPTGGVGFFESINDKDVAFQLLDIARQWLQEKGMEAMDGPINFGENDTNWGLLVEGFTQPGFGMPYHMPYYKAFFEEYGFKNYFEQYSYHKDVGAVDVFPERFMKIAAWIAKKPGYSFEHFSFKNSRKFVEDVVEIYNATWSRFKDDFTPIDPEILEESMRKGKSFIDEELIWFAYHNNKPVAFFILFPDLNQIIKPFKGKLNTFNKIRFLYARLTHKMTRMRAFVAGVHPSYQNTGIESAIFLKLFHVFRKKRWYQELELSWVGDYNPKMISIYEAIGAKRAKKHITYRYMINSNLPFVRYIDEMPAQSDIKQSSSE